MQLLGNWSFIYKKETHIDTVERDEKKSPASNFLYVFIADVVACKDTVYKL
jgi:hypothetical protein